MMKLLLLALAVTAVNECCDVKHAGYALAAENVVLCQTRGGIPITTPVTDDGSHTFVILTSCAFPCDQRLQVEKP